MFHILNPFPDILTYNLFAPIILRVMLGYLLISFGYAKMKSQGSESTDESVSSEISARLFLPRAVLRWIGMVEIIVGIAFIIGLGVQIDAIISAFIFLGMIIFYDKIDELKKQSRGAYTLLFIVSLSLLLSGAGLLAIDLPL